MAEKESKKSESTGMYTAGFVLGIIGVVFAFIPLMYWVAYILGALALIFGIIGLVKKAEGHKALTSTILGAVALVVAIVMNIVTINTAKNILDSADDVVTNFLSNYSDDALGKTADVTVLGYQEVDDNFWGDNAVVVKIKNISDETLSFSVSIEALDEDGNRIDTSDVYAESLAPGQSTTENAFTLSTLDEDVLENAEYHIYRVTSY